MSPKDSRQFKHGSYKVACNKKYGTTTYGWLDGNPVHRMTTADGTGVTHVSGQVACEKLQVNSPTVIPKYNSAMQAVDHIDQLMHLFSLVWHHKHKHWYKQLKMAL
eukprot:14434701-Ditylum_brightwellii.AAC.1